MNSGLFWLDSGSSAGFEWARLVSGGLGSLSITVIF